MVSQRIKLIYLLEYKMQVGRKSRVCELCCSIVVVNKIDATSRCVSDLPAWWQWTQLLTVHIA